MTEFAPSTTVKLYRIENPAIKAILDGITSHKNLVGQWFAPDPDHIRPLILKKALKEPGAQLVVACVPVDTLNLYHVTEHPVASAMDVEDDNYIIPRDGWQKRPQEFA